MKNKVTNYKKGLISLIIPVYNSETFMSKCLDAIANQSYKNYEVIAVDGLSKDGSVKLLKSYEKKLTKLIIIEKESNLGLARNIGIEAASGEYMMFIDSDDIIDSNYLEIMIKEIESGDYDICISGHKSLNSNYKCFEEVRYENTPWTKYCICVAWSKLFKSSFIKEKKLLFPNVKNYEDTAFSIPAISETNKIKIIDNIGYGQVYRNESLSRFSIQNFNADIIKAETFLLEHINKNYYKNHEKEMWYFLIKYSVSCMLWSGKTANPKQFIKKNNEIFDWLEENVDMYKKNKVPSIFYPKGEKLKVRLVVHIYMLLNKLGMIKLFASLYCKG